MSSNPALSLLDSVFNRLADTLPAPDWLVQEGHRRIVLLINHVLMQEPQAQARLRSHTGRRVHIQWRQYTLNLRVTPACLFELCGSDLGSDLEVHVMEDAPSALAEALVAGRAPKLQISGDVALAATISWLGENVRWDLEEDLSRVVGDVLAHQIVGVAKAVASGLRGFARSAPSPVHAVGAGGPLP